MLTHDPADDRRVEGADDHRWLGSQNDLALTFVVETAAADAIAAIAGGTTPRRDCTTAERAHADADAAKAVTVAKPRTTGAKSRRDPRAVETVEGCGERATAGVAVEHAGDARAAKQPRERARDHLLV